MDRRECLKSVFGIAVATAIAPFVDFSDATPGFWNQPAILERAPWIVTFPDGTVFRFSAEVVAEELDSDGNVSLTLQPTGPMTAAHEEPLETMGVRIVPPPEELRPTAELLEIEPPSFTRSDGIKSVGSFSITWGRV